MTDSNQLETLREVFSRCLELPADTPVEKLRRCEIQSWDSLAHISLVTTIENTFGIVFEADEYANLTSYEAVVELLPFKLKS